MSKISTKELAATAIMGALVTVATMIFIPFAPTSGFFNLGDAIVVTTALLFGPIVGAMAGGIGSALADIILQYAHFAPYTLVIKGLEGFIVGYIGNPKNNPSTTRLIIAWIVGGVTIVVGYWIAEAFFMGYGIAAATAEIIINVPQVLFAVLGIPLSRAVRDRLKSFF
ncbi:ECF transporter S component [Thermoproteota archaeon]